MGRSLLLATLACASVARAQGELSEERARQILPRADLTGLSGKTTPVSTEELVSFTRG